MDEDLGGGATQGSLGVTRIEHEPPAPVASGGPIGRRGLSKATVATVAGVGAAYVRPTFQSFGVPKVLAVSQPPPPPPPIYSGCTPGYWKQSHHFDSWPLPYTPTTLFESVFLRNVSGNPTLLYALKLNGGHLNALMRHATAALLNAAHPNVHPDPAFDTTAEVIAAFQNAFDSGDYEDTKDALDESNNLGCLLN